MSVHSLEDALIDEIKDILHAEKQITKALPRMAKKADHPELRKAFEQHLQETEKQIERLEQVFELMERAPRGKTCEAMKGIIEEGKSHLKEDAEPDVLDAMLIADAQKVEHYEIASYGTAIAWAKQLGMDRVAGLLEQTLVEEKETDQKLTELALKLVNREAAQVAS